MKMLLPLLFLVSFKPSWGQGIDKCEILKKVMEDSTARQVYKLYLNPGVPIVFYDKTGFFDDCNDNILTERITQVVRDTTNINKTNNYRVVVFVHPKKGNQYLIELYSERTHGFAAAQVKASKSKFYILSKRYGILD